MSTDPRELAEAALAASTADGCVAIATEHTEANLRWAANALTTNGQMQTRSVTVVATFGERAGVVTRAISSLEEVDDLVRAAEQSARDSEPAEDVAPLVAPYDHPDEWAADPRGTGVEVFGAFAGELGETLGQWRAADRLLYGFAEHRLDSTFLATSTGLRRRVDQPDGRLELNGKSGDLARSAWAGVSTRDFADVDVVAVADSLTRRLDWARTSLDLPPGRYETILPPTAVADLMIDAYWSMSARDAEEGRTVFSGPAGGTRVGERLSSMPLTLRSDPGAVGLQCAPFEIARASSTGVQSVFDNGAPVPAASWLTDGVLTELARSRASALPCGAAARPYVDNLILEARGAEASLEQMIADTERGLLLTCLWYIREVDPQTLLLTGLTRDGVYLVENGQVRGAVNNFRFNESPVDLLGRVTEAGVTERTLPREWSDYFTRAAMPALRVADFNMSTVSPAS